tara:strand:- start:215 stop:415 length:201 start_codon:yes stop_codon:yes gene_type:complete
MAIENQILFISYITLAGVIAMIYGLRRIFLLERKIVRLEATILGKKIPKKKKLLRRKTVKRKKKRK